MVTWIRSAAIAPGKVAESYAFVRKAAEHVQAKHGIAIAVSRPLAGYPTRIFWTARHSDLQAYESDHRAIGSDPEFQKMMAEAGPCFLAGTTHDEILQSI